MATLLETSRSAAFPAAAVEACIRDALADQAADQAVLRPDRGTATATPVAARPWEPEIDSLVVVEVICAIEELLRIEIPPTFSPKGGYDSTEACVNDLMSEAKAAWDELTKEKETHERARRVFAAIH
jgi:acyl carrier protein